VLLAGSLPDVLLLVEVADSSQQHDQWRRALLYARHGIPAYWVVSLPTDSVVYRDPASDGYHSQQELGRDRQVAPLAFPDRELAVTDLLGQPPGIKVLWSGPPDRPSPAV
jgi:Uma2 family endonuclease